MALIDDVFEMTRKLVGNGWDELLDRVAGLKIDQRTPAALKAELLRPLPQIDRGVPGFADFAADGKQAITPRRPAQSLLYHALSSPNVLSTPAGVRLKSFPTWAEIETVENFVFGVAPPTLASLQAIGGPLEVVVFAYEYRPASQTTHRVYADMVYARTGIARVGDTPASYVGEMRGFHPLEAGDDFAICVSPARFAAYLAVRVPGSKQKHLPMRFRGQPTDNDVDGWVPDDQRAFWVPVHKLFPGAECLAGVPIDGIRFEPTLINEKIGRAHLQIGDPRTKIFPYWFSHGIAGMSTVQEHGSGVLVPNPSPLVEAAANGMQRVTVRLRPDGQMPGTSRGFDTLNIKPDDGRHAPEYVHIRTEVVADGTARDLNQLSDDASNDVLTRKLASAYDAQHYLDHTGDGWVNVIVDSPGMFAAGIPARARPAYALVTAPDFFPSCDQRELSEWTAEDLPLPKGWKDQIWFQEPLCLCDQRLAPNVQTTDATGENPLDRDELTVTALVPLLDSFPDGTQPPTSPALRHSHLPDDAAGTFAPGWDVSRDSFTDPAGANAIWHLSAYGLGSPFPEDSKLCAALSTFWPAVAPDITRVMEKNPGRNSGTVAPLTDEEIGQVGNLPWDGVPGPVVVDDGLRQFVDYANFRHVDYVKNAIDRKFTLRLTARVDSREYQQRTLAAALGFIFLGGGQPSDPSPPVGFLSKVRLKWRMLSFRKVNPGDPELERARLGRAPSLLTGDVYRMECYTAKSEPVVQTPNFFRVRIEVDERKTLFVSPSTLEVVG